jgi:hypothetical protein
MTFEEAMAFLNDASDPQIATIYSRRNPAGRVLGVRYADIYALAKKIKRDSELARKLWATGYAEAREVACRIMNPADLSEDEIDAWIGAVEFPTVADSVANLVYRTPFADQKRTEWTASRLEFVRRAGFALVYAAAADPKSGMTDDELIVYLNQIGREIHESPNWSREMMNMAPIAIGLRNAKLKEAALAVTTAYGTVDVFHGDKTQCKVWDAVEALNNPRTKVKPPA